MLQTESVSANALQAILYNQSVAHLNATESDAGNLFYTQLSEKTKVLFPGSDMKPVRFSEQGDFHWYYTDITSIHKGRFNSATFDYLSGNVDGGPQLELPDVYKPSSSGTFPIDYANLLDRITFTLSKADEDKLREAQQKVQTQERQVIQSYESTFGEITSDDLTAAGVKAPLDYVISYVLGALWSGAVPPLTWVQMREARSLTSLLPLMPASGNQVLTKTSEYLTALGPSASIEDQRSQGSFKLRQLKTNTRFPSAANGGMTLVVPPGTIPISDGYSPKYQISKPIDEIEGDLNNKGRKIDLRMSTSKFDETAISVSFSGNAVRFRLGSLITFTGTESESYNMNRVDGASADSTIDFSFTGVSSVPAAASSWQEATNTGWYYGRPIQDAWANWKRAQRNEPTLTGYTFTSDPLLGDSGRGLGRLTSLFISNRPSIKITYTNADYRKFEENWRTVSKGNVMLFGFIVIGSSSQTAYSSRLEQGSSNSTFTLTFEPTASTAGPLLERTAYVIGGEVDFPAASK